MNMFVEENQDSRTSQGPKEKTISNKEEIFTCIKYCRGAKSEMMEAQLLALAVRKPLVSGSRSNTFFPSIRAALDKIISFKTFKKLDFCKH